MSKLTLQQLEYSLHLAKAALEKATAPPVKLSRTYRFSKRGPSVSEIRAMRKRVQYFEDAIALKEAEQKAA